MKLKLGKVFDLILPILAGLFVQQVDKRAEKRGQKKELDRTE